MRSIWCRRRLLVVGWGLWMAVRMLVALVMALAVVSPAHASTFANPFATYEETVGADAPTAYWRFGETSGTTAADASGNGRAATYARDAERLSRWGALGSDFEDHAIESWNEL